MRYFACVLAILALVGDGSAQTVAYTGATVWDGTGASAIVDAVLVVRDGRVLSLGTNEPPAGVATVDVEGRWIVPGLINAHGHVDGRWAPPGMTDPERRVLEDLSLYARYGVTTVNSLGGGGEASVRLRNRQGSADLEHSRLLVAGPVITASDPVGGREWVDRNAELGVDWIKFRVDDNLGSTSKMSVETYEAIIDRAHALDLRVATHLFYLEDAIGLLDAGTDLIAHSVRDRGIDQEFMSKLRQSGVCYVPTLTREVSTFVYADRPDFFDDPFFQEHASESEVSRVLEPTFQSRMRGSTTAARYREGLGRAQRNLAALVEAGLPVAMGTDSGPAGRFPGYFEHLEMEMMVESGLTPEQALMSATSVAADCLGMDDVGTLEPGRWADFLVLGDSPLADISNTKSLLQVYIAGNAVR